MNALLDQTKELLCEHDATFSFGQAKNCRCTSCRVYKITVNDKEFEADTFAEVVSLAWSEAISEHPVQN